MSATRSPFVPSRTYSSSSASTARSRSDVYSPDFSSPTGTRPTLSPQTSFPLSDSPKFQSNFSSPLPSPGLENGHSQLGAAAQIHSPKPQDSFDDVDRLAYTYSLRVAVLSNHLSNPPVPALNRLTLSPGGPSPLNSPGLSGTSPGGSRFSVSPGSSGKNDPRATMFSEKGAAWPAPAEKEKSLSSKKSFGFLGKSSKSDGDGLKLPKDFLTEFWQVMATEDGDPGWHQAVSTFLAQVKKGTKTASGMNLREISVLLEAFTHAIPPPSAKSASVHVHQTHLLQLLYDQLPLLAYFSPIARAQTEKDRDLCFRLRSEVQTYIQNTAAAGRAEGVMSTPKQSPLLGSGRPAVTPGSAGTPGLRPMPSTGDFTTKRKPSPIWTEELGDLPELVGTVWSIPRDKLERDVESIKSYGSMDQMYTKDIKRALSSLGALGGATTPAQRDRQASLQHALSALMRDFPGVADPVSPGTYEPDTPRGDSSSSLFFTPPRKVEVFVRLSARVSERAGHNPRSHDLLDRCKDLWAVTGKKERESEMRALLPAWVHAIGTPQEIDAARPLIDAVRDVSFALRASEPLPAGMEELLQHLLGIISSTMIEILPVRTTPPPRPPPTVLPLFNAGRDAFLASPTAARRVAELSDELKGMAVSAYVTAAGDVMGGVNGDMGSRNRYTVMTGGNRSDKDSQIEGFENLARWIEDEVSTVRKVWGNGLGTKLNPAATLLSKQLPLFLAELQALDQPRGSAANIFPLYEITGKLLQQWEALCPGQDHGFELDAAFEPHIKAWLRDTEQNSSTDWVNRAIGMDTWIPEGSGKHSQSVIDLFEFIRGSAQVILSELPLSEYKRAVYTVDLSRSVSSAITQYANTVGALFEADMSPAKAGTPTSEISNKLNDKLGSKASSWLAKGQQAVKNLEKKKVEGFTVPAVACVKLTDMGAAKDCVEDLMSSLHAEETARIIRQHSHRSANEKATRHAFTITVTRGENLLSRSQTKAADAFVVITDKESGERVLKSRTVLGAEDPKWEQSIEVSVGAMKVMELSAWDRQLVGKHDLIGSTTFKLDPRAFGECGTRDVLLPLSPRGLVHLRISMDGGERHDVAYHLSTCVRALDRQAEDMTREIVDRIAEYARSVLSVNNLKEVTKPLRDKKKPRMALSDGEIEASLGPLFEYLNENFSVFSATLPEPTRIHLMLVLWRRFIDILISVLIPPLSDRPWKEGVLSPAETGIVFKWLQLLKSFFNAAEDGEEHGVPMMELQKGAYKDMIMLGQYLDLPTPQLKERALAAVKAAGGRGAAAGQGGLNGRAVAGASSVEGGEEKVAEIMLRIARTRNDTSDFLQTQVAQLTRARIERQAGVL